MNHDVVEEIKQEDRKSMKMFAIIMVCSLLVGGVVGFAMGMMEDADFMTIFTDGLAGVIQGISHYIILILSVIVSVIVSIIYRRDRKMYAAWDGEEEETLNKIEGELNLALILMNTNTILMYVFMVIGFGELLTFETYGRAEFIRVGIFLAGVIVSLILLTIGNSKIINFEKEMNPEKKGSAYDIKFQKKWLESCDEAEKMAIYKASFASYKAVNTTCMILWFVTLLGITIWDYGIVPVIFVGIIWLVSSLSYFIEAAKLTRNTSK